MLSAHFDYISGRERGACPQLSRIHQAARLQALTPTDTVATIMIPKLQSIICKAGIMIPLWVGLSMGMI